MQTAHASRRSLRTDRSESPSQPDESATVRRKWLSPGTFRWFAVLVASVLLLGVGAFTARWWFPPIQGLRVLPESPAEPAAGAHEEGKKNATLWRWRPGLEEHRGHRAVRTSGRADGLEKTIAFPGSWSSVPAVHR